MNESLPQSVLNVAIIYCVGFGAAEDVNAILIGDVQ